jgi:hypothetical protein
MGPKELECKDWTGSRKSSLTDVLENSDLVLRFHDFISNYMEQSLSWEADSHSAIQEIFYLFQNK